MEKIVLLLISILPVYIIIRYVYNKDNEKEPIKLLIKLFIFGILSCIPAVVLEVLLGNIFGDIEELNLYKLFLYVLICVAFVEEICKWIIVMKTTYNNKEFDQIYDAIIYSVLVSLGFAFIENIFYVYDGGITIGLFRAISAIPSHAANAIVMGNYIGLSKIAKINNNSKVYYKNLYLSIFMPVILHTLYDYFIFTGKLAFIIIFFVFLIYIYYYSINILKKICNNNIKINNN